MTDLVKIMSYRKNALFLIASKCVLIACGIISGSLINRGLTTIDRGIYSEIQTWIGLFIVVFGFGIDTAIYHHANKEMYSSTDYEKFKTTITISFITSLMAFALITASQVLFQNVFTPDTGMYVYYIALIISVQLLNRNLSTFLYSRNIITVSSTVLTLQFCINLLLIVFYYLDNNISLQTILKSLLISQFVIFVVFLVIYKYYRYSLLCFSFKGFFEVLFSGLKQYIGVVANFSYMRINQILLIRMCSSEELGYYGVAFSISSAFSLIPEALQTALYPRVIQYSDDYRITIRTLKYLAICMLIILTVLYFSSKVVVDIFAGKRYDSSIHLFQILLVSVFFQSLSSLVAPYYIKKGYIGLGSLTTVILALISLPINLILISSSNAVGAAIATSVSSFIGFCLSIFLLQTIRKRELTVC